MTLQLVMPDVVKMLVAFLRAQPEVVALCGASASIRGKLVKNTVYPAVRVLRITSEPINQRPFVVESVRVQLECYGGNNRQAERLAQTCRAALAERAVGYGSAEGLITKVVPAGLNDLPDEAFTPARERYIAEVDIWMRAAPG